MTLVPIIYTSLIIFAALLFTVIIISYLSFKFRSRNAKQPSERVGMASEFILPKQIVLKGPKLNVNPIPVRAGRQVKSNYSNQIIVRERRDRKEDLSQTQVSNRKDSYSIKNEVRKQNPRNERTSLRATRIEIMNESNSFRNTSDSYQSSAKNYVNRDKMVEANLFNYYDNSTESDFVAIASLLRRAQ